jgi:hypothetical protein
VERLRWSSSVSVPSGVFRQELPGDESVALNLQTEEYYGLDPIATRMWLALEECRSVDGAYEQLLGEYEVEPATLRDHLIGFVDQLVERGLLVVVDRR